MRRVVLHVLCRAIKIVALAGRILLRFLARDGLCLFQRIQRHEEVIEQIALQLRILLILFLPDRALRAEAHDAESAGVVVGHPRSRVGCRVGWNFFGWYRRIVFRRNPRCDLRRRLHRRQQVVRRERFGDKVYQRERGVEILRGDHIRPAIARIIRGVLPLLRYIDAVDLFDDLHTIGLIG